MSVETGELALKEVLEVFVREHDGLLHIETERSVIIDATTSHPFYVIGKGWTAAGDLIIGDAFYALSDDVGVVTDLTLEKLDEPILVYNLDVADFDTYFVGDGVLVHNKCLSNPKANTVGKFFGYDGAEDFKEAIAGTGFGGRFNINIDKATREVILESVQKGGVSIRTGLFYPRQ